jgi:RNA polymerase sigma-70 factor (ECF subfamily)
MDGIVDSSMRIEHPRMVGRVHTAFGDDNELVIAAQAGDREAFGRLYERFAPMVHGVLLTRVPYGEVDDLVQDVFLTAFRRLSALRAPGAFGAWLAAIARNRAVDYHRRQPVEQLAEDIPAADARPQAEARAVLAVIQSLPVAYQETLMLRLVEGMTGQEIADRTGLTPASVRVNLHRGMKRLREALASNRGAR